MAGAVVGATGEAVGAIGAAVGVTGAAVGEIGATDGAIGGLVLPHVPKTVVSSQAFSSSTIPGTLC